MLNYKAEYNFSTGIISMWAGSTLVDQTSGFDPAIDWTAPWRPEFCTETKHTESDIPGIPSNHVTISGMKRLADRNGNWRNMQNSGLGIIGSPPTRYNREWTTQPKAGDVWTDPL